MVRRMRQGISTHAPTCNSCLHANACTSTHLDHKFAPAYHMKVALVQAVLAPLCVLWVRVSACASSAARCALHRIMCKLLLTSLNSSLLPTIMPLLSNAPPLQARLLMKALSGLLATIDVEC